MKWRNQTPNTLILHATLLLVSFFALFLCSDNLIPGADWIWQ